MIDHKLIEKYDCGVSRNALAERKKRGIARVRYLRVQGSRTFYLLVTHGKHPIFEEEQLRDIRENTLKFAGYSVSIRPHFKLGNEKLVPHVRMDLKSYREVKKRFRELACDRPLQWWERKFWNFPLEPYAPLRRQLFALLRMVNRERGERGVAGKLDWKRCLRLRRRILTVFVEIERTSSEGVVG